MKILILDDEESGLLELRKLLKPHTDVEVVAAVKNVDEALLMTGTHTPDVAFLDVRLRGETAFDYIGKLGENPPHFIFVTAYDTYAVRGFECNALDYLLKPIQSNRLDQALDRVRKQDRLEPRGVTDDDSLLIRDGETARFVSWSSIQSIEANGNYSNVVTQEGREVLVLRTLNTWLTLVPANSFVQIHRGTLVRLDAIRELRMTGPKRREVVLSCGRRYPVSRSRWAALKEELLARHPEAVRLLR